MEHSVAHGGPGVSKDEAHLSGVVTAISLCSLEMASFDLESHSQS